MRLDLSGNILNGTLPHTLVNCWMFEELNIGNNDISYPFSFGMEPLPNLRALSLKSSKVKLPFPKLQILDMFYNEFTGFLENFKAMINVSENEIHAGFYFSTILLKGFEYEL